MSHRLIRTLVARSLGRHIPPPLYPWLVGLYQQIDLIESERDFLVWLSMLDKLPGVYRRTGVKYDIASHWTRGVKETPMDFFDAAATETKDWSNIFLKVDNKDRDSYVSFWDWTGPNPYQVQIWLAEVVRKFFNFLWEEHNQMLEEQRNSEGHGKSVKIEEGEVGEPVDEEEAQSWKELELLERKLLKREEENQEEERREKTPGR